jgi:hypothetical protein
MNKLKSLWLKIINKLLADTIQLFGWLLAGAIYFIIFGGILSFFAIPIVLLFKLI